MAYRRPNTHQIPNEVCDKHMKDLSGSEFKVLYLIARKTCGFHRDVEALGTDRICRYTGLSKESVRSAVKSLESEGLICREIQHNSETNVYSDTLYWLAIDEEEGDTPLPQKLGEGPAPTLPQKLGEGPLNIGAPLPQNLGSIIGTKETSIQTSVNSPVVPTALQPKNNCTLDLDDAPGTFVQNAYRRCNRRAKLDSLKTRGGERVLMRLVKAEAEYGPETFREALLSYLSSDNETVVRARWPIRMFLDHIDWHLPAAPPARHAPAAPSEDVSGHPASSDAATGLQIGVSSPEISYPDRWNELVPSAKVEWNPRHDQPLLAAALKDPDFTRQFEEICNRSRALLEADPEGVWYLDFRWLLRYKDGAPNWWKVLSGQLKPKPKRKSSTKEDPLANLKKELGLE